MSDELHAVEGRVDGRVQGVFYRGSMRAEAERLGVQGWARNLPDGGVAFFAQGPRADVEQLLRWAEAGPPAAEVREVSAQPASPRSDLDGFEVA